MTAQPKKAPGFTLIELMIVVAIIGLLAAIAIPKFGDMILRSKESSAKGALGTLRSAIDIYYVANEGRFPNDTAVLTTGGFIQFLPKVSIPTVPQYSNPGHPESNLVQFYAAPNQFGAAGEGTRMWAYVTTGNDMGHAGFNCIHMDTKSSSWSEN